MGAGAEHKDPTAVADKKLLKSLDKNRTGREKKLYGGVKAVMPCILS